MKFEFNFSLKTDGEEILNHHVEIESDSLSPKLLAAQIVKQLEMCRLDNELRYLTKYEMASLGSSVPTGSLG